jgi:hypothetical protein
MFSVKFLVDCIFFKIIINVFLKLIFYLLSPLLHAQIPLIRARRRRNMAPKSGDPGDITPIK